MICKILGHKWKVIQTSIAEDGHRYRKGISKCTRCSKAKIVWKTLRGLGYWKQIITTWTEALRFLEKEIRNNATIQQEDNTVNGVSRLQRID